MPILVDISVSIAELHSDFFIFKLLATAVLDFEKLEILTGGRL